MKLNTKNPTVVIRSTFSRLVRTLGLGSCLLTGISLTPLLPGGESKSFEEKVLIVEEVEKPWSAELTAGWDSLYMFRGVNVIRGDQEYGSGLAWTDLSASWNLSANDTITAGVWLAFGVDRTSYKEVDAYVGYTRTIGDLSLGLGYIFYDAFSGPLYSHELNASVAYTFHLPADITITPALIYYFNLGPDADGGSGIAEAGSSFLQARVDAGIPIFRDIISLEPWVGFGASFGYNYLDNGSTLTGANNLEVGIALPIKINETITVSGYAAYSTQWAGLVGTEPNTFWGGAQVTFSF